MPLSTGIIAAWLAGGQAGSGSTFVDVTGNGHDATIQSGINWFTSDVGFGLDWNGSANIADFGATPIAFGRGVTMFVRFRSLPAGGSADSTIMTYETGYNNGFGGFRIDGSVKPQFLDFTGGFISSNVALASDVYTDICITVDAGGTGTVYLDGTAVSSATSGAILGSNYIFKNFGFDFFGLYHLKGKIANPAFWGRALTAPEVAQLTSDPDALYNDIAGVASLSGVAGGVVLGDLMEDYLDGEYTGASGRVILGNDQFTLGADVNLTYSGPRGGVLLGDLYYVAYSTASFSGTRGGLVLGQRLDGGARYTSSALVLGQVLNPSTLQTAILGDAGRVRLGGRYTSRGGGLRRGYRR